MAEKPEIIDESGDKYKYGFVTNIESETVPKGLNEGIIRLISRKKGEPEWLLEKRLAAYRFWLNMKEPTWAKLSYDKINYQDLFYYAAPKQKAAPKSLNEVDPALLDTYNKLGIPLKEQEVLAGVVAVDAVFDSVSVATTYRAKLAEQGIIFCSISEAVKNHPDLVQKYLGSVVPYTDNFFACLNSAVFTDGSFVYIPKGVKCPMELSTYFRINAKNTGQFERTLIIVDEGASVHYVEGCTAPNYSSASLHAAIVEIFALEGSYMRYSTIQNWSDNVYNLVTKRATAKKNATVEWIDGNLGAKTTMKYPSVYLDGEGARGTMLSIAFANQGQHQDTGAKMIHNAPHTSSSIVSKSIAKGGGKVDYRGQVTFNKESKKSVSHIECDTIIMDDLSRSDTIPFNEIHNSQVALEHEAKVSKISEEQLYYLMSRGLSEQEATEMIVMGFVEPFTKELPMEYAVELNRLISYEMEGSVG